MSHNWLNNPNNSSLSCIDEQKTCNDTNYQKILTLQVIFLLCISLAQIATVQIYDLSIKYHVICQCYRNISNFSKITQGIIYNFKFSTFPS